MSFPFGDDQFKTEPRPYQFKGFQKLTNREFFALLMEQGTGKSKVAIDDWARLWRYGEIDRVVVMAPNGVETNWVLKEIPAHQPDWCPGQAFKYKKGLANKLPPYVPGQLIIVCISYDAMNTPHGKAFMDSFTSVGSLLLISDESHYIKNPDAARTKAVFKIAARSKYRRILTGTAVDNGPFDVYSQFMFLDPHILRCASYAAFKAYYGVMLESKDNRIRGMMAKRKALTGKAGRTPQIIARDVLGRPLYRNLEKLQALIAPHSYRVLKRDVLTEIPPKVYQTRYFEMSPAQAKVYKDVKKHLRTTIGDQIILVQNKLIAQTRLQQVTSGYIVDEGGGFHRIEEHTPRLGCLLDQIADNPVPTIVWAKYTDEIEQVLAALSPIAPCVRYDGKVSDADRIKAIDAFQSGQAFFFVANQAAGSTGITLTAAEQMIYYSNSFRLGHRSQSEDRAHRIGQHKTLLIVDIAAEDSIDLKITDRLVHKQEIADVVNGDDLI